MAKRVSNPTHNVEEVVGRLRHATSRIVQAITWARANNEAWRFLNNYENRQKIANGRASAVAHVYERSTLDAQIMNISRVFDKPGNGDILLQNRMSFPVCEAFLKIPGVLDFFLEQSDAWNEFSNENRSQVKERHDAFFQSLEALKNEEPNKVKLIRGFRDENIAHELRFDVLPQRPQYNQVHELISEASTIAGHLSFVVQGNTILWPQGQISRSAKWMWDAVREANLR